MLSVAGFYGMMDPKKGTMIGKHVIMLSGCDGRPMHAGTQKEHLKEQPKEHPK